MTEDLVNHPSHYAGQGKVECKDFMKVIVHGYEEYVAACVANIVKYCWRCHGKEPVRSLQSARWYFREACDFISALPSSEKSRLFSVGVYYVNEFDTADVFGQSFSKESVLYKEVMEQMKTVFSPVEMDCFMSIMKSLADCGLYRDVSLFTPLKSKNIIPSFETVGSKLDLWIEYCKANMAGGNDED